LRRRWWFEFISEPFDYQSVELRELLAAFGGLLKEENISGEIAGFPFPFRVLLSTKGHFLWAKYDIRGPEASITRAAAHAVEVIETASPKIEKWSSTNTLSKPYV